MPVTGIVEMIYMKNARKIGTQHYAEKKKKKT